MKRSLSGQKRFSADKKVRLASPSPLRKKNSWKSDDEEKKQDHVEKKPIPDLPKIPHAKKSNMSKSFINPSTNLVEHVENNRKMSLSMANLQSLKKTTIVMVKEPPSGNKKRAFT